MRALIIGAGAVGRYIAARLQLAGHDAVLFARAQAAGTRAGGYRVEFEGTARDVNVPVAVAAGDAPLQAPFELAVVAVKAFATAGAIETIRAISACDAATLLTVQNGLGNEEQLAGAFSADRIVAGALTTAVDRTSAGAIVASHKGGLALAPVGALPHNWLIAAIGQTGMRVDAAADWRALKWSKLLINIQANAVCAILDWTPEQLYRDKMAFAIERRCTLEATMVMDAARITPVALPGFPVPLLAAAARTLPEPMLRYVLASRVARARGGKLPSLLIDARAHAQRTEVDALNGAIAVHALRAGRSAPANAAVAETLDGIIGGSIPWDDVRGKPAALASRIG
ncbi:MAG: 2-dehydropantoate 2-reductase [Candidatus Eremiobacteraeota bacterium]|nr:2-dehydropantoate 2-reductase [Candidatus Eremiobacteraeota bacterium]